MNPDVLDGGILRESERGEEKDMSNSYKVLVGSLFLAAALTACGKKGKSSNTAAAGVAAIPGVSVAGGCSLDANGICQPGTYSTSGVVGIGKWRGNLVIVDSNMYRQFLMETNQCGTFQSFGYSPYGNNGYGCQIFSSQIRLDVQTAQEFLPMSANDQTAWFGINYRARGRHPVGGFAQYADAFGKADNSGFQLIFNTLGAPGANRYLGYAQPYGYSNPGVRYAPTVVAPGQPITSFAAVNSTVQIVLTYIDPLRTVLDAQLIYKPRNSGTATVIARGQIRGYVQSQQLGLGVNYAQPTFQAPAPIVYAPQPVQPNNLPYCYPNCK
ncbi:MAG: hypothetical protein AB7F86_14935 [Bdellovibrionales bacterium]